MESERNGLERLFSEKLEGYKHAPSAGLWDNINKQVNTPVKRKVNWTALLVFPVLFTITVGVLLRESEHADVVSVDEKSISVVKVKSDTSKTNPVVVVKPLVYNEKTEVAVDDSSEMLVSERELEHGFSNIESVLKEELIHDDIVNTPVDTDNKEEKNVTDFVLSEYKGCAPLTVFFKNKSNVVNNSVWSFGDGMTIHSVDAYYTYSKPGVYVVSLTTSLAGRDITVRVDTITVYDKPQADCELSANGNSGDVPVFFNNYSRGAAVYEWSLGDSIISKDKEPIKYSDELKGVSVKLKVWSRFECVDSLVVTNPVAQGSQFFITFPNAFVPDNTGASGGRYMANARSTNVFYPKHKGLVEYSLQIHNRFGMKVFEAKDVEVGWDGYYQGKLLKQDVYIWKVRGTYSDGKTFEKWGDVILLRKQ